MLNVLIFLIIAGIATLGLMLIEGPCKNTRFVKVLNKLSDYTDEEES